MAYTPTCGSEAQNWHHDAEPIIRADLAREAVRGHSIQTLASHPTSPQPHAMFPFLGPPHSPQLAAIIRHAVVVAWWLMPAIFLLCAAHFSRVGDRRGRKLLVRYAAAVLVGLLVVATLSYVGGGFATHGSRSLLNTLLSTGKCLFAPDLFCGWPEGQLIVVPTIYLLLTILVVSRRRARANQGAA